ncbi:hypothetical protein FPZ43_03825 [Mucilaginibacter pallidiroseus]|uniref:Outer membrane protein beta-barrel domain-containing protein n=1 Tax=Mucilaginibacter pallidiroseus TaxID=2599295 RepID=A0A563UJQ0_9SPHI|nr:hypothetical protein [Mucilaginibacter pallidiroseus]TWR31610.1 hypothetical protein FPZ43_03825 [Mucilaginibacter pallidiroseus]
MKKLLLALLSITLAITASAQTGKGQKFVGGSFYLNYDEAGTVSYYNYATGSTTYSQTNVLNLNISPEIGLFLTDKLAVSIQPGYSRVSGTETSAFYSSVNSAQNYVYTRDYHTDYAGLSVNFRYYWMLSNKFGIYPQAGISTSHVINDFKQGGLAIGGGPNVVFFPTESIGLNMGFGAINYRYNYTTHTSNFTTSLNNNFTFGINYYW